MESPVYAGAYAFGRSVMRTEVRDGRKRAVQRKITHLEDWAILIKDAHEGYISWKRYERNRQVMADNAQVSGREGARGAVRGAAALLAGPLRCCHCGIKLTVTYSGRWNMFRHTCGTRSMNRGDDKCIGFGGRRADEAAGEALLRAIDKDREAKSDAVRQAELALEPARYEADRAFRQFDEVDPENRQVAAELERRWNGCRKPTGRSAWVTWSGPRALISAPILNGPGATYGSRRRFASGSCAPPSSRRWRMSRTGVSGLSCTCREAIKARSPSKSPHRYVTDEEASAIITALARQVADDSIAAMLNRSGRLTCKGRRWRKANVASFRAYRKIPACREGEEKERGEVGVREAARILGVHDRTVISRIASGRLPAWQVCKGARWVVRIDDLSPERNPAQPSLFDARPDGGSAQEGGCQT